MYNACTKRLERNKKLHKADIKTQYFKEFPETAVLFTVLILRRGFKFAVFLIAELFQVSKQALQIFCPRCCCCCCSLGVAGRDLYAIDTG